MKIGKAKPKGIAGYTPARKKGDPLPPGHGFRSPSSYREEYCDSIIEYFSSAESWQISYDAKASAKVMPVTKLPTFERWAAGIGVDMSTLYLWCGKHPDFKRAYGIAKDLQKAFLLELGAAGVANHVTALMLRTNHGMKDESEDKKEQDGPIQRVVVEVVGASQHKSD